MSENQTAAQKIEGYFTGVLDVYFAVMSQEDTARSAPVYGAMKVLASTIEVTITPQYKEGKVKAIGLSNFPDELLLEAIDTMEIMPQVVQVEAHPYFPQTELKQILARTGMALMAWYPLGHGDKTLIQQPVFTELAAKYGKSNAQIILRWHVQSGNIVIPGSKNPDHIRDNFDIFDFALTDADMAAIAKVNSGLRYYTATLETIAAYAKMELQPDL